jgi:hypothetical protein
VVSVTNRCGRILRDIYSLYIDPVKNRSGPCSPVAISTELLRLPNELDDKINVSPVYITP